MQKNRPPSLPPEEAEESGWGCPPLLISLGEADWPGVRLLGNSSGFPAGNRSQTTSISILSLPKLAKTGHSVTGSQSLDHLEAFQYILKMRKGMVWLPSVSDSHSSNPFPPTADWGGAPFLGPHLW